MIHNAHDTPAVSVREPEGGTDVRIGYDTALSLRVGRAVLLSRISAFDATFNLYAHIHEHAFAGKVITVESAIDCQGIGLPIGAFHGGADHDASTADGGVADPIHKAADDDLVVAIDDRRRGE